jgi:hypothetical protein
MPICCVAKPQVGKTSTAIIEPLYTSLIQKYRWHKRLSEKVKLLLDIDKNRKLSKEQSKAFREITRVRYNNGYGIKRDQPLHIKILTMLSYGTAVQQVWRDIILRLGMEKELNDYGFDLTKRRLETDLSRMGVHIEVTCMGSQFKIKPELDSNIEIFIDECQWGLIKGGKLDRTLNEIGIEYDKGRLESGLPKNVAMIYVSATPNAIAKTDCHLVTIDASSGYNNFLGSLLDDPSTICEFEKKLDISGKTFLNMDSFFERIESVDGFHLVKYGDSSNKFYTQDMKPTLKHLQKEGVIDYMEIHSLSDIPISDIRDIMTIKPKKSTVIAVKGYGEAGDRIPNEHFSTWAILTPMGNEEALIQTVGRPCGYEQLPDDFALYVLDHERVIDTVRKYENGEELTGTWHESKTDKEKTIFHSEIIPLSNEQVRQLDEANRVYKKQRDIIRGIVEPYFQSATNKNPEYLASADLQVYRCSTQNKESIMPKVLRNLNEPTSARPHWKNRYDKYHVAWVDESYSEMIERMAKKPPFTNEDGLQEVHKDFESYMEDNDLQSESGQYLIVSWDTGEFTEKNETFYIKKNSCLGV